MFSAEFRADGSDAVFDGLDTEEKDDSGVFAFHKACVWPGLPKHRSLVQRVEPRSRVQMVLPTRALFLD